MLAVIMIGSAVNGLANDEHHTPATEQQQGTAQTTCPVMKGKINKNLYVDYKGKRIYVCCHGCINAVKADPEKYIKEMEKKGISLQKVDTVTHATEKNDKNNKEHENH